MSNYNIYQVKCKGKGHPTNGHELPEEE